MKSFWPYLETNCRTINTVLYDLLSLSLEDRLTDNELRDIA